MPLLRKAVLDRLGAAVLLLLCGPGILLITMLLWLHDDGPIFVRERRMGEWGRSFSLLRFRTPASALGAALRRHSLDELPRLINVVKGDMSLVGPRPPAAANRRRSQQGLPLLSMKPGLTGPWPAGRGPRTREDSSVELDRYLRNWSPAGDLAILWQWLREAVRGPASGTGG
jgi:lipopolysaccharide/colanic/teichoic acid biosynthesis glycosyltransferase